MTAPYAPLQPTSGKYIRSPATRLLNWRVDRGREPFDPLMHRGGQRVSLFGDCPRSRLFQQFDRFLAPLHENAAACTEWRWDGLTEPFYTFEGFRNHHVVFGLKLSL